MGLKKNAVHPHKRHCKQYHNFGNIAEISEETNISLFWLQKSQFVVKSAKILCRDPYQEDEFLKTKKRQHFRNFFRVRNVAIHLENSQQTTFLSDFSADLEDDLNNGVKLLIFLSVKLPSTWWTLSLVCGCEDLSGFLLGSGTRKPTQHSSWCCWDLTDTKRHQLRVILPLNFFFFWAFRVSIRGAVVVRLLE